MPRKKMIKRKVKVKGNAKAKNNFSEAALGKVEKEFFTIPGKLVKNATKHLTVLQKRTDKLSKTLAKTTMLVTKLEKKLLDMKQSKKAVKRALVNAVVKQHQTALKQQTALSKEHKEASLNLRPIQAFHAKFNFLSKQLVQFDKEWATLQKNQSAEKQLSKQKVKTEKKRLVKTPDANAFASNTATPVSSLQTDDTMEIEESALSESNGS